MNRRQRNIAKRRRRILEAARSIIAEQGPDELSMRTLASHAGLAVATLYNLFGSKDDILMALISDALSVVAPLIERQSETDALAALQSLLVGPIEHVVAHADVFRPIISVGYFDAANRAAPHLVTLYSGFLATISGFVETAQAQGYLVPAIAPGLVASEIFYTYRLALEDWGCHEIDHAALARRVEVGGLLILLAIATPKARPQLWNRLENLRSESCSDLAERFPGLAGSYLDERQSR